jgi:hypothetical protein
MTPATRPTLPRRFARVREQDGRLLLTFYVCDRATFDTIKRDLKATFRCHRDRCWRSTEQCWSFPAYHRRLLGEWLDCHFALGQVTWTHTELKKENTR